MSRRLAAALALLPGLAAAAPLPPDTVAALDAAIAAAMAEHDLPGVAVGIWIPGRGDYVAAHGIADRDTGTRRTVADPFRIGSVTKTFIATAALQLAEDGALDLEAPIATWFPDFPTGDAITVDDLLRMRSGIFDSWTEAELQAFYDHPLDTPTAAEMIAAAGAASDLFAPPDSETVYTNINYVMLDAIVAAVAGKPTPEVLAERIFAPLGLTGSLLPTGPEVPGPLRGYGLDPATGGLVDKTELDPQAVGGAGAMISTLADLEPYVRALCTGTLLEPETQAARMRTEPFAGGPDTVRYGQGVAQLGPFCGHNGTIMGFSTEAWYLPAEDAVIVVNVNRLDADDQSTSGPLLGALVPIAFPDALK